MRLEGQSMLLRIFIGESDRWHGQPLYHAIVELARKEGLAGATVLRGIEGFGADSHMHTARILRLSEDLPIVIEVVDTAENVNRIMPMLDSMIAEGLVTTERVHVVAYRGAGAGHMPVDERSDPD
jgi:PII-like signaling protein